MIDIDSRELMQQIRNLRHELSTIATQGHGLSSPEVLQISRKLDRLLVAAQHLFAASEGEGEEEPATGSQQAPANNDDGEQVFAGEG